MTTATVGGFAPPPQPVMVSARDVELLQRASLAPSAAPPSAAPGWVSFDAAPPAGILPPQPAVLTFAQGFEEEPAKVDPSLVQPSVSWETFDVPGVGSPGAPAAPQQPRSFFEESLHAPAAPGGSGGGAPAAAPAADPFAGAAAGGGAAAAAPAPAPPGPPTAPLGAPPAAGTAGRSEQAPSAAAAPTSQSLNPFDE